ncbi:MAG: signal recognition particle-docking protein FtsY [Acidimicrobiaceae bacterium]|nr:signal recognition particle-docking protein FtsY [Acidimicrobiaceae bacterium]
MTVLQIILLVSAVSLLLIATVTVSRVRNRSSDSRQQYKKPAKSTVQPEKPLHPATTGTTGNNLEPDEPAETEPEQPEEHGKAENLKEADGEIAADPKKSARPEEPELEESEEPDRPAEAEADTAHEETETEAVEEARPSLRDRLKKARNALTSSLAQTLKRSTISEETWDELTETLIRADVGLKITDELIEKTKDKTRSSKLKTPAEVVVALQEEIRESLRMDNRDLLKSSNPDKPSIWLFLGVNGAGKTTTIGKLAMQESRSGTRIMLAAGDTFRAAAAEQLAIWAERTGADIVKGAAGADPASVVYDSVASAAAKGFDLVMVDTAGRLHTNHNLIDELRKIRRVADKGAAKVTEVLLVLDATMGQNGLAQARQFTEAVDVTGVVLTKLDGSAKGGIVVAVQTELNIPVKLVGVGEGLGDLMPFDETEFTDALFN